MGTITNRLGLEKPVLTDQFSTQKIADNWQAIDDKAVAFAQNIWANRPAASTPGKVFVGTDDGQMSYDDGSRWLRIPSAPAGGQHLFEKGTSTNPGLGFAGDDNTGVGSLSADSLHLITAGRWHWRVNAAGELGGRNFSAATATALATQQTGQAHPRWTSRADGYMQWGSGVGAPDVSLYRDAAARLRLSGDLLVTGKAFIEREILDTSSGVSVLTFDENTVNVGSGGQSQARVPPGSYSTPGFAWQTDTDSGFTRRSSGATSWVGNGLEGGYLFEGGMRLMDGSESRPSLSFIGDTNSGLRSGGDGNVRVVCNGLDRLEIAGSRMTVNSHQLRVPNGTQGAPGIQFDDPDTGFFHRTSDNEVGLSIEGIEELLVTPGAFVVPNVYNSTTSSSANVNVGFRGGKAGALYRVTSLAKFKNNVASIRKRESKVAQQDTIFDRGRDLDPISFTSKLPEDNKGTVMLGMIAEKVAQTVPELAVYDEDGELQSVAYDRVGVLALAYALEALDELDAIKERLA